MWSQRLSAVVLLFTLSCVAVIHASPTCLVCDGIQDPRSCTSTATCDSSAGEDVCFIQENMKDGMNFSYSMGCGRSSSCNQDMGQALLLGRDAGERQSPDLVTCYRCCSTDLCNAVHCHELCVGQSCQNGGTCVGTRYSQYHLCLCPLGFTGDNCQYSVNDCPPDACVHGDCVDKLNDFECLCHPGYNGSRCQENIDDCASSPCVRGSCVDGVNDFSCSCPSGYDGKRCDHDINDCSPNPCVHGSCVDKVADYQCNCQAGWSGQTCATNINDCSPNPCVRGSCQDLVHDYHCSCPSGFNGKRCESNINDCSPNPCVHGSCVDKVADYQCNCQAGWSGKTCATNIYDCSPNPCAHGTCVDLVAGYRCQCEGGWRGGNCNEQIPSSGGGCFPGEGRVRRGDGALVPLHEVRVGDLVLTSDAQFRPVFSPVLYFLYRHETLNTTYRQLWTEGKAEPLTLTPSHAIFVYDVTTGQWQSKLAGDVIPGMRVGVLSPGNQTLSPRLVTNVTQKQMTSAFSPLTGSGTIIVDDVTSSCYGKHADHNEAHMALTWARGLYGLGAWLGLTNQETGQELQGRHWSVDLTLKLACLVSSQAWCE